MNHGNRITLLLIFESILVLIGLLARRDVWVGVVCYWVTLLMKHVNDYLEENNTGQKE